VDEIRAQNYELALLAVIIYYVQMDIRGQEEKLINAAIVDKSLI